jgi:hypothetical protein
MYVDTNIPRHDSKQNNKLLTSQIIEEININNKENEIENIGMRYDEESNIYYINYR